MSLHHEYLPATGSAQQELVLLHGWGCNREVWRPLLTRLRSWANVTLMDVPGCAPGSGSVKPLVLSDVLDSVLACCPERAVFVGWSLGGQIAAELAALVPERVAALVTICSNPRFLAMQNWPGMDALMFEDFRDGLASDPSAALQRFDSLMVTGSRQPRQLLRQLRQHQRLPATAELLAGLDWLKRLDERELISALTQPRLHLFAQDDALVPHQVSQQIVSDASERLLAKVKVLPRTSHLVPLDAPVELAYEIHHFLARANISGVCHEALPELEKKDVAASFSRAATRYDSVARLQRDVGGQLLTYLERLPKEPDRVLDLGCGTGFFRAALKVRYPQAQYLGLDLAEGMVDYARKRSSDDSLWLVADAEALPLASESVDLIFSSLAVQWCSRLEHLFAELARVLRPGSLCVFTSLGPLTLCELRDAWATVDSHQHVNTFAPLGDLVAAAQRIPGIEMQLDRRAFCMEYDRVRDLLDELKVLGAHNMNRRRPVGLTSRRALQGMLAAYENQRSNGVLPATYDVIFGMVEKS
ncbi:MAG: malonyl-ACP O-methyltransferase BioC [Halioglobus sp.]